MSEKLIAALKRLDVANENHWNKDGSPKVETIRMLTGTSSVSKDDIEAAAPGFSRTNNTFAAAASAGGATAGGTPTQGSETPVPGAAGAAGVQQPGTPVSLVVPTSTTDPITLPQNADGASAVALAVTSLPTTVPGLATDPQGKVELQDLQEAVEQGTGIQLADSDSIESLQAQLAAADEDLADFRVHLEKANQELAKRQADRDALADRITVATPTEDANAAYKRSVEAQLENKIALSKELGEAGLLSGLGRSPVDTAIAANVLANRRARAQGGLK